MEIAPDIQSQIDFEHLYNKNQVMKRLGEEFRTEEVENHCLEHGIPIDFAVALMSQMVLHKRATVDILVGILYRHFEDEKAPFQACADMLVKAAEHDLVDFDEVWKTDYATGKKVCEPTFILRIDVDNQVYEDLDRYQYPLPMLVKPLLVMGNKDSGYFTFKKSVILRDNHTEDDVYIDHINRCNNIQYSINTDVVRMIQNKWKSLDKKQPDETVKDYQARVKAFEKYDRVSRDVIDHLVMNGNCFYITVRYDKRGRSYTQGYHVNPQGNPWNKACVEFANKEVVRLK